VGAKAPHNIYSTNEVGGRITVFLLNWLILRHKGRKIEVICIKCESIKIKNDKNLQCPCGGIFKDLERMKWIDGK